MLVRNGYSVATAANGVEALQLLAERPFDVVLTDMNMPVMDGVELTRQIHARGITAKVIPMSGAHPMSQQLLSEVARLGARPPLHKPFNVAQLLAAVKAAAG